ncbi:hypothetical protein CDG76_25180 [Nostoc sp. 'Peltigera membranacea cyanobiont' 210A]|uniref:pentapeptide repeat-containing protein n=1 Tax=Nostoc sp. 'Peltigera membranacea cyanobiont' 210A TaxID=2014529 RepID=UPI000B95A2D7|nr:pentapeptide repeat-containing protein [Nostoc sp. 'Peltigera membranacea cyanobiont' 210A]OYD91940.1 hypothetical protein CDG76_25180 [Nostoc sp. 'Peltigera membranacea cyanobiont' 210A]
MDRKELIQRYAAGERDFREVDLSGAVWDKWENPIGAPDLSGINLSRAKLRKSRLVGINFSDAKFIHADLIDAKLSCANLSRADLSSANLINADLIRANLSCANLRDSDTENIYTIVISHFIG